MTADIGQQMQQLYSRFGEIAGVTIELHKDLLAVNVENQAASARVFLQGAQLADFQLKHPQQGLTPIIWCSEHCDYSAGNSLRGGIPICWPWFGDLKRNAQAVQDCITASEQAVSDHGFVRHMNWQLDDIKQLNDHSTQLNLSLSLATDQYPSWPHATDLTLKITVASSLTVAFKVTNRSQQPVSFASALHSYFSVDNIANTQVSGLDQCRYIDCLNDWQQSSQQGTIEFTAETDRLYYLAEKSSTQNLSDPILIHRSKKQATCLQSNGSQSAVVWNPWIDKAKRLSQFSDDDYQTMLCIETANAGDDFVTLAPAQSHCLSATISAL
jgi:glucose-6-phosphate 1-epimerase